MIVSVRFRLKVAKMDGLKRAPQILNRHMTGGLKGIGKRLVASSRKYMRRDSGDEHKSLKVEITGSGFENKKLEVYSQIIQAFIDAYGLRRGVFAPYHRGSRLYRWTRKRLLSGASRFHGDSGTPSATEQGPVSPMSRLNSEYIRRAGGRVVPVRSVSRVTQIGTVSSAIRNDPVEKAAWAIARSVFRHGIRPTHWNERALDANRNHIINDIRNAISRAANEMSRG